MAKRYYYALKEITSEQDWMEKEFSDTPIRTGRTIEDPDFPRIAITYSLDENTEESTVRQGEMKNIIEEYNDYYGTSWSLAEIERYNGDINNRLARKRAEFKQFGKQIDLVIVVDRLLTGFDAPTIQTLFVDRNLNYANLIQAFSRTNRTYPDKEKGLIVTFRKPHTMEQNVAEATKLYSEAKEESGLIYPTYEVSKKRFKKAHTKIKKFTIVPGNVDEQSNLETQVEYIKAYQELNNAYKALVTYDEYNDEMQMSKTLQNQVHVVEEQMGTYNTVKGFVEKNMDLNPVQPLDFSEIEFYSENKAKLYDIDASYINKLLDTYSAYDQDIRNEIEKAMQKLNKAEQVKQVYRAILNAIDNEQLDSNEDIFVIKRQFFTDAKETAVNRFAKKWFVAEHQLHLSAIQYVIGADPIPNIGDIIDSKDYELYKIVNPDAKPFKYAQAIKKEWRKVLDESIVPLDDELR